MPYIEHRPRAELRALEPRVGDRVPSTAGELNYVLAKHVDLYLSRVKRGYAAFNEVVGVLECLKLEVYRRLVAPYEDEKCEANGDVFSVRKEGL